MMIAASQQRGILDENEEAMINRVFGFAEMVTEQVMVPRTEIEAIPIRATLEEVTKIVAESGHSRYPVYGENLDDIRAFSTPKTSIGCWHGTSSTGSISAAWCVPRSWWRSRPISMTCSAA